MADTDVSGQAGSQMPQQNFFQGLGLEPPKNVEHRTVESAGTATDLGVFTKSTIQQSEQKGDNYQNSSANIDSANPSMLAPDRNLSDMSPSEAHAAKINQFLCCIYAVALEMVMAEIVKRSSYQERVDSKAFLNLTTESREMAELQAQLQIDKGKLEMYTSFAKAICCGVSVGVNLGVAGGSAVWGPRTATGAAINSLGQALNSLGGSDSVTSNLATGISATKTANIDAQVTILQNLQQFAQQMTDRIEQDRKDTADAKNQVLQAFQQWMNAMYAFTQKG